MNRRRLLATILGVSGALVLWLLLMGATAYVALAYDLPFAVIQWSLIAAACGGPWLCIGVMKLLTRPLRR